MISMLLSSILLGCATTAGTERPEDLDQEPEMVDVLAVRMAEHLDEVDEARSRGEIDALRDDLDAQAAESKDPWLVVQAAFASIEEDPDGAWSRLREVTVTPRGSVPAEYWAWLGMADISLGWGIYDQARMHIDRALEIAPGTTPAMARAGLLAIATGSKEEGAELLREVMESEEAHLHSPRAAVALAELELAGGRDDVARTHLEELLSHHPRNVGALLILASMAESEGHYGAAAEHLEKALLVSPEDAEIAERLARLRESAGDSEAALEAWRRVSSITPDSLEPWKRTAELANELGEREAEKEAVRNIRRLDPSDHFGVRRLAEILTLEESFDEAREAWTEVISREPDDQEALLTRARILADSERLREAMADLRAVVRIGEDVDAAEEEETPSSPELVEEAESLLDELSREVGLPSRPVSGRSPDAVYAAVSRVVNRAYMSRLESMPALGGTYSVKVIVSEGTVDDAEIVENSLHDPVLEALIYWTIFDARFPHEESAREFTLPFTLTAGEG